jgi:tetratricopeptide (TPR) repeat protein
MAGNATFAGTSYQARVIAFIYVHLLAQMRLGWLFPFDDTPLAVSGETEGPGDDARIEFGGRHSEIEVQAKHGLTAGAEIQRVFQRIHEQALRGDPTEVVLVVNREGSSRKLYGTFAADLERMRTGRADGLGQDTSAILAAFDSKGYDRELLGRVRVVAIDIDRDNHPEAKIALHLLGSLLEDPGQLSAAWAVLLGDASDMCARKLRRTRKELVDLLAGADIRLQPLAKDARWHRQLEFTRGLLEKQHGDVALPILSELDAQLTRAPDGAKVDPFVRYRLAQQRAAAYLQTGRDGDALASARDALDIDPNGSHALVVATFAATSMGELARAEAFAARGVAAHPADPDVWCAKAQLALASGAPMPAPPAAVAESPRYRTMLARIAADTAEWQEALDLTAGLLTEGVRSAEVLFIRANVLMWRVGSPAADEDVERCQDAERLASELIATLADETHPQTVKALVLRSAARRALGRGEEADADLTLARELKADDPDALRHAVQAHVQADEYDAALELLRHPVVDGFAELLVLRAQLLAHLKEGAGARRDLDTLLRQTTGKDVQATVRMDAVDVALSLGEVELARTILNGVPEAEREDSAYARAKGRIEFQTGNLDEAVAAYADAVRRDETLRVPYLSELGYELLRVGRSAEAVQAFRDAGEDQLSPGALRYYAAALYESNELAPLQALIDSIALEQPLPEWALAVATDVALRQEDVEAAIAHLGTLVERGAARPRERIQLARLLLDRGRVEDAHDHVESLLAEPGLSALGRMGLAQLLRDMGREEEAFSIALRAFRDRAEDPRIHRALVNIAIWGKGSAEATPITGPNTHIRLRSAEGTREHTIYAEPPIDPLRGEMSVADANVAGLLGKSAGDTVVQHRGTWQEKIWTVEEVLPAVVHVFRDVIAHYEERFPGEPFFVTGFNVGDLDTVRSWAPIVGSLEAKKEANSEIFAFYREHFPPLGVVAKMLGVSTPEVMDAIRNDPDVAAPLMVEWSNPEGRTNSQLAAVSATEVVLTRSGLHTADELGLLHTVAAEFTLLAPRSLIDEMEEEFRGAERLVERGHTMIGNAGAGITLTQLEAGDASLVDRRDRIREILDWLGYSATLVNRPLETIPAAGSREEEVRDHLGRSSYDAAALAKHRGAVMYADDLGLRRFVPVQNPHGSFSTVSLLQSLVERGALTASMRDKHLLTLVARNTGQVTASPELLMEALRRSDEIGRKGLMKAFWLLATSNLTVAAAAHILVQVVRAQALAPIQLVSASHILSLGLGAMSEAWPLRLCIQAIAQATSELLIVLPQLRTEVIEACKEFMTPAVGGIDSGRSH